MEKNILIGGLSSPQNGWAVIFAGGSASGKSTLINRMPFKGEILSTDTFGEEQMEVHNNANKYAVEDSQRLAFAEQVVKAGLFSRFPNPRVANKVQNLHLDFNSPAIKASTLSALLSNGAHRYKELYFKAHIDSCAAASMKNIILDMTGKEREVNLYWDYLKGKGYKIALIWVVANRSVALLWNSQRRRSMKVSGVHAGHHGPNSWLLDGLVDGRCNKFDDVWIVFNSTERIHREMTDEEKENSVIQLIKENNQYVVDSELKNRIATVLGPLAQDEYVASAWMKKFFLRYRMIRKIAAEKELDIPEVKQFILSFLDKDKGYAEDQIKRFYKGLGIKEPKLPVAPNECYDVNAPIPCQFPSESEYREALNQYDYQKLLYKKAMEEWNLYNAQFEPNIQFQNIISENIMAKANTHTSFNYDFSKNPIDKYSKKVQEIDETICKAEASDVTLLSAFFEKVKELGMPICFFGAGGAASPATFASQLANAEGLVSMTLTPMGVNSLSPSVVKKMVFLAITASGGPVDMQAATEYLLSIAPEQVYCLTTNAIDHKNRFGKYDNKVGQMVSNFNPDHAICVNLSVHSDGFVGTNKHVGLSLLLYRSFHPSESDFVSKLLLPDVVPYIERFPMGMNMGDVSDLHILYGALGRSAANDMEGRMVETGVLPAMATDLKNFTHGRHAFLDKHDKSTILMLLSPQDEKFASDMLKLIPDDRPLIIIRTQRDDILGALQLMICTFYLSIDICAPRGINPYSPGAPSWGAKLWSLRLKK